jgi:hypothetical protein
MKWKLYLGTLLMAGLAWFSSCEKADGTDAKLDGSTLEGVWDMRLMLGGDVAYGPINLLRRKPNQWIFRGTTFQRIYGDSVWREGTYSVSKGTGVNLNTGADVDQFIFNNQPAESFELRDDTLRIYYGLIPADGVIELYVKVDD